MLIVYRSGFIDVIGKLVEGPSLLLTISLVLNQLSAASKIIIF